MRSKRTGLIEAMSYYHSQSPETAQARANIEFGLSTYLLKTTTMSFCYVGRDHEFAIARAKHRYLTIAGMKFVEKFVDAVYRLREQQGTWKIWTKQDALKMKAKEKCL